MQVLKKHQLQQFDQVRLVVEGGSDIVSIWDAWDLAQEQGVDLVLLSEDTIPPVVKVVDFKKLEYEKKKSQKKTSRVDLKEIQLRPNISDHDLETKVRAIQRFLDDKDKVKVVVRTKGREQFQPARIEELLQKVISKVSCKVTRIPGQGLLLEP